MADDNHTLPVLRNAVVGGVEQFIFNHVSEGLKARYYFIKIPFVGVKQAANILKKPDLWLKPFDGRDENGETVPRIFQALLKAANTERLTGWTANHDLSLWQWGVRREENLFTRPKKIFLVCCATIDFHLKSMRGETLRFKPERKAATSRKKIENQRLSIRLNAQGPIQYL